MSDIDTDHKQVLHRYLESPGRVPWWGPAKAAVTLSQIPVHMIAETAHHAGHADIVREMLIGSANQDPNVPDWTAERWAGYRVKLKAIAESAGADDSCS